MAAARPTSAFSEFKSMSGSSSLPCEYCSEHVTAEHLGSHKDHCSQRLVPCPLVSVGCCMMLPASVMKAHVNDTRYHLQLATKALETLQGKQTSSTSSASSSGPGPLQSTSSARQPTRQRRRRRVRMRKFFRSTSLGDSEHKSTCDQLLSTAVQHTTPQRRKRKRLPTREEVLSATPSTPTTGPDCAPSAGDEKHPENVSMGPGLITTAQFVHWELGMLKASYPGLSMSWRPLNSPFSESLLTFTLLSMSLHVAVPPCYPFQSVFYYTGRSGVNENTDVVNDIAMQLSARVLSAPKPLTISGLVAQWTRTFGMIQPSVDALRGSAAPHAYKLPSFMTQLLPAHHPTHTATACASVSGTRNPKRVKACA